MRPRATFRDVIEDLGHMARGVLDFKSFYKGLQAGTDPVQIIIRAPHSDGTPCHAHQGCLGLTCTDCSCGTPGKLKAVRRTFNLRTKPVTTIQGGTNQQANAMGLAYSNATSAFATGTSTGSAATTLTDTGQSGNWTTDMWRGMIVVVGSVYGIITSNTTTVLTVDKWHNPILTDTTGSTPGATSAYFIVAGGAPAHYIGLSNDGTAPAATDTTLASEISTNGLSRALSTFAYVDATPAYTITHTWTATATQASQKAGMFNASVNGVLWFENTYGPVTLATNDTLQLTWTVSI